MKGLFHKRVLLLPFHNLTKKDSPTPTPTEPQSPANSYFDPNNTASQPSSASPVSASTSSALPPITVVLSPGGTSQAHTGKPASSRGRRSRPPSLVESIPEEGAYDEARGRQSSPSGDGHSEANSGRMLEGSRNERSSSTNALHRQRSRFSLLFSARPGRSSSASLSTSPAPSLSWFRSSSMERVNIDESDGESIADVRPGNAFDQESDSDSDSGGSEPSLVDKANSESDSLEQDQTILANTTANAIGSVKPIDYLQSSDQPVPFIDQAPNLTAPPAPIAFLSVECPRQERRKTSLASKSTSLRRKKSTHGAGVQLPLNVARPVYEKNRCTITIEHGDRAAALGTAQRTRFYLVASDMSEESKYAIEWTIGTVLRQGDECLILNVIETENKFDPDGAGTTADRMAKIRNQKDRQEEATRLVREATALLERTKLNVKVTCQALHAKNSKHMLIDAIDYLEPNLVIVGSRGLGSIKGALMGSVSHYLVQHSAVPVMVARRKLRAPPKVYKRKSELDRQPRMRLDQAAIDKESHNSQVAELVSGAANAEPGPPSPSRASEELAPENNKGKACAVDHE